MILIQWEREVVRVLGKEKGREMGVAIFVDNLGIGPGNVLATLREEVREVRGLVRAGRVQANWGFGKGGKGFCKNWQGPGQGGYGKGGNGKGFGYQGTCFNCQQVGHKAAECTNARVAQISEVGTEVQVGSVEVDGPSSGNVWWIGCVER